MNKQIVVLEVSGGIPTTVKCFLDNGVGNRQAEEHFVNLVKKSESELSSCIPDDEIIRYYFDNGHYERNDYDIYLINEQ